MIILHGFATSNYFNMVKHALMFKGCDFEENTIYPQAPGLRAISATGKVPAITTASGQHLAETSVILDYLEDLHPQPRLYPETAEARAQTRQLMKVLELYLDIPARKLLPAVLGRQTPDPTVAKQTQDSLTKGCEMVAQLTSMAPYALGDQLSMADIFMRYALSIPTMVKPLLPDSDPLLAVPGLAEWQRIMANTDIARRIDADQAANYAEFMARISAKSK